MKYYKVKDDWFFVNKKGDGLHLIKDELFTTSEMKKRGFPFNEEYFDTVELKRSQTHYVFGVRKENIGIS